MGIDIFSNTGVLVTVEQLSRIVHEGNRSVVCRFLLNRTAELLKDIRINKKYSRHASWELEGFRSQAAVLVRAFEHLSINSDLESVRTMLRDMSQATESSDGDYFVREDEIVVAIWAMIIEELYPDVPRPTRLVVVSSPRSQDLDLPRGQVLLVFSEEECYERVKTEAGERLDAMLGEETELTSWTIYSY
jgi:hypothetical protein